MTIKEAVCVLKIIKDYYTDEENVGNGMMFDSCEVEAVDKAIEVLEQEEKGGMHQKVERNIQYEILEDINKARAFARLTKSIQNFILVMGDIDIHLDIKTRKEGD